MASPTPATVRKLFALCGNSCAFQDPDTGHGCEFELARPDWPVTRGEVAHICGESPQAPRFDATVDAKAFENLIVLCPTHHQQIDYLEPDRFTVAVLMEMKATHETRAEPNWASEADLDRYAILVLKVQFGVDVPTGLLDGGGDFEARGNVGAVNEVGISGSLEVPPAQRIEPEGIPSSSAVGVPTIATPAPEPKATGDVGTFTEGEHIVIGIDDGLAGADDVESDLAPAVDPSGRVQSRGRRS